MHTHTKRVLFKSLVKLFIQTCSIASLSYHCFYIFMAGCLCSLKLLQYRQHKYASAIYSNNDHIEKVREDEERKQKKLFWNSKIKLRVSKPFAVTICKQRFFFVLFSFFLFWQRNVMLLIVFIILTFYSKMI